MKFKNTYILRLEGLATFLAILYFYQQTGYSWWWFVTFLLVDISMIGYLANKTVGRHIYNLGHSTIMPIFLLVNAYEFKSTILIVVSLLWLAHISFDRMQGYGLKEEKGFKHTHLGTIGSKK